MDLSRSKVQNIDLILERIRILEMYQTIKQLSHQNKLEDNLQHLLG